MRISLIIAAGGSGSRFRAGLSKAGKKAADPAPTKLFHTLAGTPLLLRTLQAFQSVPEVKETIVALPQGVEAVVKNWAKAHRLKSIRCVRGGKTRAESVQRALRAASAKQGWVMVHDGARPLVESAAVRRLTGQAAKRSWDACLLAKKVVPTIKQTASGRMRVEQTLDRERLYEAETPQLFRKASLQKAYRALRQFKGRAPTDEAALMEKAGYAVELVAHDGWNPKITSVSDFELAESFLRRKQGLETRMGLGSDTHRLIAGRPFWLGGVRLESAYGPLGHSDGDVLWHALMDALLGAAALGDIGELFSDQDPKNKNRASSDMLAAVLEKLRRKGWKPVQIDAVVHLERPKLGAAKKAMVFSTARLLGLNAENVSIKAKTFEGVGTGGAGLLVSCEVLAVIERI